jgi:hypothetical protein
MIFDDYVWLPEEFDPNFAKFGKATWSREELLQAIAKNPEHSPKPAVDAFMAAMVGHYDVVGQTYQIALRKTKASPVRPPKSVERSRWLPWLKGGGPQP